MQTTDFSMLDLYQLPSPCFVVDEVAIENNLKILNHIQQQSGAKILHALKAFSMHALAPLSSKYLSGTCASGLHEALLAKQYYDGEIHVFSAAFSKVELDELLTFADHIVFNSCSQFFRFAKECKQAKQQRPQLHIGLRINPEHSEGSIPIYDPCDKHSRLGITYKELEHALNDATFNNYFEQLITGLHFHTLCEQGYEPLARTLAVFEQKFQPFLSQMQWVNFGGGHHLTSPDYDTNALTQTIIDFQARYQLAVYLEPGEAIAIGSGALVSEVLDIKQANEDHAIMDVSATCHMPDTLEMPYRAEILDSSKAYAKPHTYRLGGLTCLAGDSMGQYSFDEPLEIGQRLIFEDMAHYTMVKTTTFNGAKLPALVIWNSNNQQTRIVREFTYHDFATRLS